MSGTHVIRSQVLEIELAGGESEGFALQERLTQLARDGLGPQLERVFDRLVPANEHWLFDRVEIDAGTFLLQDLDRAFVGAVTQSFERYLRERAPRHGGSSPPRKSAQALAGPPTPAADVRLLEAMERKSEAQAIEDAFVYFLHSGVLP